MEGSRLQKDKEIKEVQALIDIGKKRGYVTYEEVNSTLPMHLISSDDLDDVMIMFSENDIEVVNQAKKAADQEARGPAPEEPKKLADLAMTARRAWVGTRGGGGVNFPLTLRNARAMVQVWPGCRSGLP